MIWAVIALAAAGIGIEILRANERIDADIEALRFQLLLRGSDNHDR